MPNNQSFVISTFYNFVEINHAVDIKNQIVTTLKPMQILGTIILANEGINGTISGTRESIDAAYAFFKQHKILAHTEFKETFYHKIPFNKLKVKIKNEVVSMCAPSVYQKVNHIKPEDWDNFISQPDVVVIDSRNDYEYHIGTFDKAINPDIKTFRDFPQWLLDNITDKNTKIATFCTGGVRCEKFVPWAIENGYKNIYHLQGGIIGYFLQTKNKNKKWHGKCFVFDDRIIINDNLESD
jgi:UPF0176 protein